MSLFRRKKSQSESFVKTALLSKYSPFSYVESYKAFRSNLDFVFMSGELNKIMITSALPNENKSSVCINTAIVLAEAGLKAVVLDCDLRKSSIQRYLQMDRKRGIGLSNIISGKISLEEGIQKVDEYGFWVVPSGDIPPNPAELLNNERMGEILDELSKKFDYVICDTAPVNVVSDALNVSKYCDGVVLAVRQDYAKRDEIRKAKAALDQVGANVVGSVLVRYKENKNLSGKNYYSNYYYNDEYGYSIATDEPDADIE